MLITGTILALATSCAAILVSTRTFRNASLTRSVQVNAVEIADVHEKLVHLTNLFKKFSGRIAQRKRREEERANGHDEDSDYDLEKQQLRTKNVAALALNRR